MNDEVRKVLETRYHIDSLCGSCGGLLDGHRDAICERCTLEMQAQDYAKVLHHVRLKLEEHLGDKFSNMGLVSGVDALGGQVKALRFALVEVGVKIDNASQMLRSHAKDVAKVIDDAEG